MNSERLGWLDSIRLIAIILIVGFHVLYEITLDPATRPIGFVGVSLFFIASGYMLALKYPGLISFDLKWLWKRYVKVASVYYLAVIAVALLFSTQVYSGAIKEVLAHLVFLDWAWPDTLFTIISPAWFVVPLMVFYILFPYINRLAKWEYSIIPAFAIMWGARVLEGGLISFNPLFFLGEFLFGIWMATGRDRNPILAVSLLSSLINPVMGLPFILFYLFHYSKVELPVATFVGRYTFEIFLFHESIMKVVFGKWEVYDLGIWISIVIVCATGILVTILSEQLQKVLIQKESS